MKAIIDFACSLTADYEPEPEPVTNGRPQAAEIFYLVEPIILGPDGWMAFENPSRTVIERRFAEGRALAFTKGETHE